MLAKTVLNHVFNSFPDEVDLCQLLAIDQFYGNLTGNRMPIKRSYQQFIDYKTYDQDSSLTWVARFSG